MTTTRLRFFPRQRIGADDLNHEQEYHRQKLREHNRMLHGWGVVCGCDVQPAPTAEKPWQVRIGPGYLVTPQGDSVTVRADVRFDLATCALSSTDGCAFARPCPPVTRRRLPESATVYLAIRYAECESRPVRVSAPGCSCDDAECQYSRIVEAYEVGCLDTLPATHRPDAVEPCIECPPDPWVVVATITLPATGRDPVTDVDPSANRRVLPSRIGGP